MAYKYIYEYLQNVTTNHYFSNDHYHWNSKAYGRYSCSRISYTYYENSKSKIKDRFGDKPEKWPDTLKFARMARNAFGHRGQLEIRNPKDSSTWRGLTLNYKNNGETMLYNHITGGDIILLMLDIDDIF